MDDLISLHQKLALERKENTQPIGHIPCFNWLQFWRDTKSEHADARKTAHYVFLGAFLNAADGPSQEEKEAFEDLAFLCNISRWLW